MKFGTTPGGGARAGVVLGSIAMVEKRLNVGLLSKHHIKERREKKVGWKGL